MSILTQQGRNVTADRIKLTLQLPDPNDHGLQEGLLLHQSMVDPLIVLATVKLLVLDKDQVVVEVVQGCSTEWHDGEEEQSVLMGSTLLYTTIKIPTVT